MTPEQIEKKQADLLKKINEITNNKNIITVTIITTEYINFYIDKNKNIILNPSQLKELSKLKLYIFMYDHKPHFYYDIKR